MNSLNPVHKVVTQLCRRHQGARASGPPRRPGVARARDLLKLVGISADRLDSYPHQLSGGMRQRVMIAMALALEPQVVIMDEPTTALDVVMQRQILGQLVELRERLGFSVLFITHDLSLLVEFSDRIAIMYGGRIVEQAPAKELYRRPAAPLQPRPAQARSPRCAAHAASWPGSPARRRTCGRCRPAARSTRGARRPSNRARTACPVLAERRGGPARAVACWLHAPTRRRHRWPSLPVPDRRPLEEIVP